MLVEKTAIASSKLLSCEGYRNHTKTTEYLSKVYVTVLALSSRSSFLEF
jgi:hypothetical protein